MTFFLLARNYANEGIRNAFSISCFAFCTLVVSGTANSILTASGATESFVLSVLVGLSFLIFVAAYFYSLVIGCYHFSALSSGGKLWIGCLLSGPIFALVFSFASLIEFDI